MHAVALREGVALVVGRAEPADVVVDDASLSRRHASIRWDELGLFVEDLGSTNGVWVDQARVESSRFAPGQEVLLGSVVLRAVVATPTLLTESPRADSDAFHDRLSEEIRRCHEFRRSCTVVALRTAADEPQWFEALRTELRVVDAMHQVGPRCALVLLAEIGVEETDHHLHRLRTGAHGIDLRLGTASFPSDGTTAESLTRAAFRDLQLRANPGGRAVSATVSVTHARATTLSEMVIESESMRELLVMVDRVARTPLPVLVTGESGAGKATLARAIHDRSDRMGRPFRTFDCGTLAPHLIESALFGEQHGTSEQGVGVSVGALEEAQGGTLFVDEVSELPLHVQASLLKSLETRRFTRVGGNGSIVLDVRFIVSTRRNLERLVLAGEFREELLYHFDAVSLDVPPLRQRLEDIAPLARMFVSRARAEWQAGVSDFDEEALDAIRMFPWPGNVRQLKNMVERAAVVASGDLITLDDLPSEVSTTAYQHLGLVGGAGVKSASLADRVDAYERALIREALEQSGGNQTRAARLLRVPRRTLAHKVKRYGLV